MNDNLPSLYKHQTDAIEKAKGKYGFCLFMEAGCGKTRTMIEILRGIYNQKRRVLPTLVLVPPVVIKNWRDELLKYSKIPKERVVLLNGTGKQRIENFTSASKESIFITNYESLLMPDLFAAFMALAKTESLVIIFDESQRIKEPSAKRTKAAWKLADLAVYKYILTGTPLLKNIGDIFSQVRSVDKNIFGTNFFVFRKTYFVDKNAFMPKLKHFPDWQMIKGAEADIRRKVDPISVWVKKEEALDLPEKVTQVIDVPLANTQIRLYKELKKDFITFLDSGEAITADLALVKTLRLMQLVSGVVQADGEKVQGIRDCQRLKAVAELIELYADNHKIIIWAVFKRNIEDIADICRARRIVFSELHGDITDKQKEIDRFRNEENCRVMIAHPAAGGVGINLIESDMSIWFSRSWNLEYDLQADARNYRSGSERHKVITRIDLVTKNTVDELCYQNLQNKKSFADRVHDLKQLLMEQGG